MKRTTITMKQRTALVLIGLQLGTLALVSAPANATPLTPTSTAPFGEKPRVVVAAIPGAFAQSGPGDISAIDSVVSMTTHLLLKTRKVTILDAAAPGEQAVAPMTVRVQVMTLTRDVDSIGGMRIPNIPGLPQRSNGQGNVQRLTSKVSVRVEILVGGEIRGSFIGRGSAQALGIAGLPGGAAGTGGDPTGTGQAGSVADVNAGFVKAARPNDEKALTKAIEDALKQAIPALEAEASA